MDADHLHHTQASKGMSEDPCIPQLRIQGLSVVQKSRYLPRMSFCVSKKHHGESTWRSVMVSVPCLASPLLPPHLPCNITNGGDRCSQLLHHGLQLAAVWGASWLRGFSLVIRRLLKVALAPLTGQRSESCVVPLMRFDGVSSLFSKCCCVQCSSVQVILVPTVGIEGEGGRNRLTPVKVTFPTTRPLS